MSPVHGQSVKVFQLRSGLKSKQLQEKLMVAQQSRQLRDSLPVDYRLAAVTEE
jgi:hypothetical protein